MLIRKYAVKFFRLRQRKRKLKLKGLRADPFNDRAGVCMYQDDLQS